GLSEKARAQEFAARDGNIDFLKKNHADLMATYKKVRGELKARFAPDDKVCPSIDMEVALANCMDSEEFFHEMVAEYLKGDKTAELEKIFAAGDWNEYKILVHALKSTSQVIGAVDLSEKARAQEFAARDGNIDFIKKNHADLMATYKKVREELSRWAGD
ncbi:MAG: Hpt domain-containing protein, partial [Selenomonadaceae bacterium]|nr:Hpt domain-containing protein [Selenomonadaceae bacterium]